MPFFGAHWAMPSVVCGIVKLTRTMYGDASITLDVAATITTIGVFDWVATGATANASGVSTKPANAVTLSFTTSSCASRRAVSAVPPSSLRTTSIGRPATVLPCCAIQSFTPASSCRPLGANGPVIDRIRPILIGSACASAGVLATAGRPAAAASAASLPSVARLPLLLSTIA